MKYYILNKAEVKSDIFTNAIVVRTKSLGKINRLRKLQKQLDKLSKEVMTELKASNRLSDEILNTFKDGCPVEEISCKDYNSLLIMPLLDTQEQRIRCCNKTDILKGSLYGNEIR